MSIIEYVIIGLLYFSAAVGLDENLNPLALYFAIPTAFILSFIKFRLYFWSNRYIKILILLYIWVFFTGFFSYFPERVIRQYNQMSGVILILMIIGNITRNRKNIPWLYGIYPIILVGMIYYLKDQLSSGAFDIQTMRMGDDKLNTNKIAYFTFFTTCAIYIFGTFKYNVILKCVIRILFILTIPLSFIIALYTASRQVLVIQMPVISMLLYVRYFTNKKIGRNIIISCVISILAISTFSDKIVDAYDNSFLKVRSEKKLEDDSRTELIEEAIEVGLHNPLLGVGPGCFVEYSTMHYFSHCSYTELFANSGLPALIVFCIAIFGFTIRSYKKYKYSRKNILLVFTVVGLVYSFYNIFYVFYIDLWLMSFFALITSHEKLIEEKINENYV